MKKAGELLLITGAGGSGRTLLSSLPFDLQSPQLSISDGCLLDAVDMVRDLGVKISDDMSWSPHIGEIAKNATSVSAWVLNVFKTRDPYLMLILYKSLVRSRLEYCSPLWISNKLADIRAIEDIQRSFTSKIEGMNHYNYWERLQKLKLLSLQRRRERYAIFHMWKILYKKAPNDVGLEFIQREDHVKAVVRPLPRCSTRLQSLYEISFPVLGAKLWNLIPKHSTVSDSFDVFKKSIDSFLEFIPDRPPILGYNAPNNNSLVAIVSRVR